MGLITLDLDRKIDACLGTLVSWLPIGSRASDAIPFLTGLDDVLDEIVSGQRASLKLPRVAFQGGALADKVLSLEIMPSETPDRLQVLVRDETELANLERNVLQQRNELTLANEALSEARQRAEAALREKSSFLANISHDLKTPLQVIMGNAEILKGDLPEDERKAFLEDVLDNSNFLLALITDLLDASVLEAGQLKLIEEAVDVSALLERILAMAGRMQGGKERRFELTLDDKKQAILADPMRLQRLLLNLVSNAVKFTDNGGWIAVRAGPTTTGDFVIEIEDDGVGIESGLIKRVFEPFMTGSAAEGVGLGLHIAKGLAELHGADLSLLSEPGSGTTAVLCLPKFRVLSASA